MKTETIIVLALIAGAVVLVSTRRQSGQTAGGMPMEPETYTGPGDAFLSRLKSAFSSSTRDDGSLDVRKVIISPDPLDAIDGVDYRL